MSATVIELTGNVGTDGKLIGPVKLEPGKAVLFPKGDRFWQGMQAIWDGLRAAGHVPRTPLEIDIELLELREWDEREERMERAHEEGRAARKTAAEGGK